MPVKVRFEYQGGPREYSFPETMPPHEMAGHIGEHLGLKGQDRIRGSADLPLTRKGKANAVEFGKLIASIGGFDRIATSPKKRTMETARIVSPNAWLRIDPALEDIKYGALEGTPSKDGIPVVNQYIVNQPDTPFPGRSKYSGEPGQSFNSYKNAMIPAVLSVADVSARNPNERIAVIMNRRSMKTFQAWMDAGGKDDLSIDNQTATSFEKDDIPNGSLWKVTGSGLEPITSLQAAGPGLYAIRHFETHWNS